MERRETEQNATLKRKDVPAKFSTELREKRRPLADCSNTITSFKSSQSSSSSLFKPINPSVSSAFLSLLSGIESKNARSSSPTDVSTHKNNADLASTPSSSKPFPSPTVSGTGDHGVFQTAYCRRSNAEKRKTRSQTKGKEITGLLSCTQARLALRDEVNEGDTGLPKSCAAHHKRRPRKEKTEKVKKQMGKRSVHESPKDYIEKQRAYFAEVDAFELPEEEVASGDEMV